MIDKDDSISRPVMKETSLNWAKITCKNLDVRYIIQEKLLLTGDENINYIHETIGGMNTKKKCMIYLRDFALELKRKVPDKC